MWGVVQLAGGALIEPGKFLSSLVSSRRADHICVMGDVRTQLSPVQKGEIWRVKIVWPNRHVSYFGKFTSEKDAIAWIEAHPNLTKPVDTVDAPPLAGD